MMAPFAARRNSDLGKDANVDFECPGPGASDCSKPGARKSIPRSMARVMEGRAHPEPVSMSVIQNAIDPSHLKEFAAPNRAS